MVLEDFNLSAWSLEVAQGFIAMTAEPGPTYLQPDSWGGAYHTLDLVFALGHWCYVFISLSPVSATAIQDPLEFRFYLLSSLTFK